MQVRDYQQQRYRSLDQAVVNWREQRLVESLLTTCHLTQGSLLDIPCGFGRFTALFARLGITATGADFSGDMVRLANTQEVPEGRGRWLHTDIFHLPFADNTFDCTFCVRLLHHRFSPAERLHLLRELARVSRRYILVSVYLSSPLHTLARHWRGTRGRLAMLTTAQWHDLARQSGLRILQQRALCRLCHAQTFAVLTKDVA
jgi:SAM-dependent methyltransferase